MLLILGLHKTHKALPLLPFFLRCSSKCNQNFTFSPIEILRNILLANLGSEERWTLFAGLPPHTTIIPSCFCNSKQGMETASFPILFSFLLFYNFTTCLFYLNCYHIILNKWAQTLSYNLSFALHFFHNNLLSIHRTSPTTKVPLPEPTITLVL